MNPIKSVFQATSDWADENNVSCDSYDSTESTNDLAKQLSLSSDLSGQPKLILANHQSKGRGRGGNSWVSPPEDTALFSSWVFDFSQPPQPIATPLAGLAVYESLTKAFPSVNFSLKAPNDVYIGFHKLAGILVEVIQKGDQHRMVLGLGLNVLKPPVDVEDTTHLLSHLTEFLTDEIWQKFMSSLLKNLEWHMPRMIQDELEMADRIVLKKALGACQLYTGTLEDVSPQGDLIFDNQTLPWHEQ